jgi:aminopeptidase N
VNLLFTIQQLDAVASSHAISIDVNKPEEINEIFDDITYGKGGCMVRMISYFIGNDTFLRGITVITKHKKLFIFLK